MELRSLDCRSLSRRSRTNYQQIILKFCHSLALHGFVMARSKGYPADHTSNRMAAERDSTILLSNCSNTQNPRGIPSHCVLSACFCSLFRVIHGNKTKLDRLATIKLLLLLLTLTLTLTHPTLPPSPFQPQADPLQQTYTREGTPPHASSFSPLAAIPREPTFCQP